MSPATISQLHLILVSQFRSSPCHCEERSDEVIPWRVRNHQEIASHRFRGGRNDGRGDISELVIQDTRLRYLVVGCGAYVRPRLRAMDRVEAQPAIATLHSFRFFHAPSLRQLRRRTLGSA
jgi:hypothetical protein